MNNQHKANIILTVVVLAITISGLYSVSKIVFQNVNETSLFLIKDKKATSNSDLPQYKSNRLSYQASNHQRSQSALSAGSRVNIQMENPTIVTRRTVSAPQQGRLSSQGQTTGFGSNYSYQVVSSINNSSYSAQPMAVAQDNGISGQRGRRAGMMAAGAPEYSLANSQFNSTSLLNSSRNNPDMILPDLKLNTSAFANEEVMMRMDEFPGDPGSNEDLPISGNVLLLLIFALPYALIRYIRN